MAQVKQIKVIGVEVHLPIMLITQMAVVVEVLAQ